MFDDSEPPEDGYGDEIDRRKEILLDKGGYCYPFERKNFSLAMEEASWEVDLAVAAFLAKGDFAGAGGYLAKVVEKYWDEQAEQQAMKEFEEEPYD